MEDLVVPARVLYTNASIFCRLSTTRRRADRTTPLVVFCVFTLSGNRLCPVRVPLDHPHRLSNLHRTRTPASLAGASLVYRTVLAIDA
jgi:hypothetical protein